MSTIQSTGLELWHRDAVDSEKDTQDTSKRDGDSPGHGIEPVAACII